MPTSGEARIHAASTYNFRSKPLPKTKQSCGVMDKENVRKAGNSRIPTRKSKLPVSSGSRKPPVPSSTSHGKKSQTRVKSVPNFEKMHKTWQKKFQQGKAVAKKPCTRTREFDLTRPGARFQSAYYSGDEHTDPEDEFEADHDALQSILDNRGLGNDVITGRSTVATMGGGRAMNSRSIEHRQTLGALPTHNNRSNMSSAVKTPRRALGMSAQRNNKSRKKSLVEEQELDDLEFQEDASALATILNDVGIQQQPTYGYDRQTIASTHARTFQQRTSIYYQPKSSNINKVYEDFARQTIGGPMSPTLLKIRECAVSQTMPKKLHASPFRNNTLSNQLQRTALFNHAATNRSHTPGRITRPKTPGTASRVLNPRVQQAIEQSCSPVRCASNQHPRSALKAQNSATTSASRNVCWAEILNSPPNQPDPMTTKDKLATALFADEDAQFEAPFSMAQRQQQELQKLKRIEAHASANRNKVEEMEAVELQLQMEIERLQMTEDVSKPTQPAVPSLQHLQTVPETQLQISTSQPQYIGQQSQSVPSLQHLQSVPASQLQMSTSQPQYIGQQSQAVPSSQHLQTVPAPQLQMSTSQPQYIEQQSQAVLSTRTMPESISQLEQNPPQSTFNPVDQGIYVRASQPQMSSVRLDNTLSSQHQLNQTNLPTAAMYSAPSHSTLISQQTHNGQFQETSAPQRQPVMSASQQRLIISSSNGYNVLPKMSQDFPPNMSQSQFNLGADNQKLAAAVIPSHVTDGRGPVTIPTATSLPPSVAMLQEKSAPQNVIPSVTDNVAGQFQSQFQAASLSSWTSQPARTFQNSSSVMHGSLLSSSQTSSSIMHGGLSTVYGMPADLIRKNTSSTTSALSPVPLMSAFAGGSPVQPTIRSTTESKPPSAMIQTPLPLKPQHHIKHRVMKQYTPAVPSMQHTVIDVPVPIQTPMAMRNATQQGQKPGFIGRLVSPVPQVATQMRQETQSQDYSDQYNLRTTTVEPKLKLNFDGVEDTPSGEVISAAYPAAFVSTSQGLGMVGQGLDSQMSGLQGKGQWNKSLAGQLFHETLLDEECALYTCRLPNKFSPKPAVDRNHNPIAKVLMEGDDMHFVPISDQLPEANVKRFVPGSAFNSYASWS